jgi:hypothetical protein
MHNIGNEDLERISRCTGAQVVHSIANLLQSNRTARLGTIDTLKSYQVGIGNWFTSIEASVQPCPCIILRAPVVHCIGLLHRAGMRDVPQQSKPHDVLTVENGRSVVVSAAILVVGQVLASNGQCLPGAGAADMQIIIDIKYVMLQSLQALVEHQACDSNGSRGSKAIATEDATFDPQQQHEQQREQQHLPMSRNWSIWQRERLILKAFAKALLVVPRALLSCRAQNVEHTIQLEAWKATALRVDEPHCAIGWNADPTCARPINAFECAIIEPLRVNLRGMSTRAYLHDSVTTSACLTGMIQR